MTRLEGLNRIHSNSALKISKNKKRLRLSCTDLYGSNKSIETQVMELDEAVMRTFQYRCCRPVDS
eukprot:CAMPEP_0184499690 /NCGR_PEP_ID=MMETSP0113_2-20130426/42251_1 /TAXON_ID=91329 /ORGANISM="Norrisiella sphaerica, Strain BC52" /LENGTH=64 /DNA_ID=CAMNT_0026887701 /DNA_START=69 /DNA_END=263 /DNA_ORIENTATION=+